MKKIVLGITMLLIAISVSACSGLTSLSQAFEFASDEEIFSFSAISTSALISDTVVEPLASVGQVAQLETQTTDMTIEQIEPYLEMFESLLAQNNGLTVVTTVSDNPLYETKSEFTVFDLLSNQITYTMYYNTVLLNSEEPATEPTEEDDEDESSTEYEITGILLIGTTEYQITGRKELEEGEEKISFTSAVDENNYVFSQYKVEDDEKKFSIKIVENGVVVSESKIKVELEDGETSIKLEYTQGANYSEYSFKYENEDGTNILKIKYETLIDGVLESGKIKVEVLIDELTQATSYQIYVEPDHDDAYEHESEREFKDRDDHDDDQDEEDDDDQDEQDDDDQNQDQTDDTTDDTTDETTTNS